VKSRVVEFLNVVDGYPMFLEDFEGLIAHCDLLSE
jgi:hypothetical protein